MKYIVITSKHHDGFAMYDSKVSDYDIVESHAIQARIRSKGSLPRRKKAGAQVLLLLFDHGLAPPGAYVDEPGKDPTAGNGRRSMKPGGKESTSST